jgi:hypothetical protein
MPTDTPALPASDLSAEVPVEPIMSDEPTPTSLAGDTPLEKNSLEGPVKGPGYDTSFPEGGPRAWAVAIACAFALFCTFGYANAFG